MVQEHVRRSQFGWGSDNYADVFLGGVRQGRAGYTSELDRTTRVMPELGAIGDKVQARVEAKLGRPLTDREASEGVYHADARDVMRQMQERQRYKDILDPPPPRPMTEVQQWKARIAAHEDQRTKEADPEGWELRQSLKEAEAKAKAEADFAKLMADPKRPAAVQAATDWLTDILFSEDAPVTEVEAARFLYALAWTTDNWALFASEMEGARKVRAATIDTRNAPTEAAWKKAVAERDALNRPFTL